MSHFTFKYPIHADNPQQQTRTGNCDPFALKKFFFLGMWYIYLFFAVPYLFLGSFFMYLDLKTALIKYRYKTPSRASLQRIYGLIGPLASFNLLITHPILTYATSCLIPPLRNTNFNLFEFLISAIVCGIIYEIIFSLSHMLFHIPCLFRHIHSIHHQLTVSVGFAGLYEHPIEYAISGFLSWFTGLLIISNEIFCTWLNINPNIHIYTICIFSAIVGSGACLSHCGYSSIHHLRHHLNWKTDYSAFGYIDWMFGTVGK